MLEVTDAAISVWGPKRVAMHLAPQCDSHDMGDSDPAATFGYVAHELGKRGIAFICAREALGPNMLGPELKRAFGGIYVANEAHTRVSGEKLIREGGADAIAYGKLFIANPDLPRRFARNAPLNTPVPETFYGSGPGGYVDYPVLTTQDS